MEDYIIPECYFDTVLVKAILNIKRVNHQKSCYKVESTVRAIDDFAVGIIDKDKKEIAYLKECKVEIATDSLILWKHTEKQHYFIQLVPAIESWILQAAKESNIDLLELHVPNELIGLRRLTKHEIANESELLKKLCKRLVSSNGKTITMLTSWLKYLYDFHRNADINRLKQNG